MQGKGLAKKFDGEFRLVLFQVEGGELFGEDRAFLGERFVFQVGYEVGHGSTLGQVKVDPAQVGPFDQRTVALDKVFVERFGIFSERAVEGIADDGRFPRRRIVARRRRLRRSVKP